MLPSLYRARQGNESTAFARQLADRDIRVMISLDGIGAAHDAQRPTLGGKPSSAMVMRTVDRLIAVGVSPHISITITGFQSGDSIQFAGENPSAISTVVGSATVAGGNTTLHLPDGSSIVLVGITKVDGTFFG